MTHWILHDNALSPAVSAGVFADLTLHGVYYEGKKHHYPQGCKAYLAPDLESFVMRHHIDPATANPEAVPVPQNHVDELDALYSDSGRKPIVFTAAVPNEVPFVIRDNYDRFEVWVPDETLRVS